MNNKYEPKNTIQLIKQLKESDVPESEFYLHINRFLENKARTLSIPLSGHFELTPLCNLDCKMCYVHLGNSQFKKNELLDAHVWKELISQAQSAGMMRATLTGGECLTYPDFDEIYLFLIDNGIIPNILSNGVLFDRDRIAFFKNHPPKMIQITIYGSSEDDYERVTGHRCFHTVFNNLQNIRDAGLPIKVSITPNEYFQKDYQHLLETIEALEIHYEINANLIAPRENTGRKLQDLSVDAYIDIFKTRHMMHHNELHPVDSTELPEESHIGVRKYGFTCGAGRSSFGIRYDGSMCPCLSLGEIVTKPLEIGFQQAWEQLNNIANTYPLPIECGDCVYYSSCLKCIAMHQNAPKPGHCNPRICERTKKLIAAGFLPMPDCSNDF